MVLNYVFIHSTTKPKQDLGGQVGGLGQFLLPVSISSMASEWFFLLVWSWAGA